MNKFFAGVAVLALSVFVLAESGALSFPALTGVLVGIPQSLGLILSGVQNNQEVFLCNNQSYSYSYCPFIVLNDTAENVTAWLQLSNMTGNGSSCLLFLTYDNGTVFSNLTEGGVFSFNASLFSMNSTFGVKVKRLVPNSKAGSCSWVSNHS